MDFSQIGQLLSTLLFIIVIVSLLGVIVYFSWKRFFSWLIFEIGELSLEDKARDVVIYEVKVPEDNDIELSQADQMFTGLAGIAKPVEGWRKSLKANDFISFEIVAFKDNIKFYVVCSTSIANIVDRQINGAFPTAEISKVKEYNLFPENGKVASRIVKLDQKTIIPIKTYDELAADPLATITDSMSKLADGEAAAMQLVITPAGSKWRNDAKSHVKKKRKKMSEKEDSDQDETLSHIERKTEKSGFYADIRLVSISETKSGAEDHVRNMFSAFDQFNKESANKFKSSPGGDSFVKDFIYRIPRESMILNTGELASIYHFPNKKIKTPHIQWLLSRDAPAADFVPSKYKKDSMWIGRNIYRGQEKDVFLSEEDRMRHMYVIGQTGTGKTKFLAGMAMRDIYAGKGVAFIDPHGSDVDMILDRIPPERVEDVIYFNPADTERPIGLNMLEFNTPEQKTFVINEMLNIFDKLYDLRATGGPIFEQYMRNSILLLMEDPESGNTLMEISRVLSDEEYRKYKLSKATNMEVIHFWEKQAEKAGGDAALQNVVPYITSKLTSFVSNDIMRPIIAQQKSTIDFRWAMDNKKIILINLSKGRIGDLNAYLLGMVIVGKILSAALSREDTLEKDRQDFYLYIDEFQNFLTESVETILSEARKYRLSLNIAHQFLGQLNVKGSTKIKDAIFGNVGNKVIMRVGIEDAQVLERDFAPIFSAQDISRQPNIHAYVKMLVDGQYPPPFSISTSWEYPHYQFMKPDTELAKTIKEISRLRFGRDREIVESEIKSTYRFKKQVEKKGGFGFGSPFGAFGGGGDPFSN